MKKRRLAPPLFSLMNAAAPGAKPGLVSRFAEWWKYRRFFRYVIAFDDAGVIRTDEYSSGATRVFELHWSDIRTVIAYKRDCYVHDLICFDFYTDDFVLTLHEHMVGWNALVDALPVYLPGMPSQCEWWQKVAQPPFAPC